MSIPWGGGRRRAPQGVVAHHRLDRLPPQARPAPDSTDERVRLSLSLSLSTKKKTALQIPRKGARSATREGRHRTPLRTLPNQNTHTVPTLFDRPEFSFAEGARLARVLPHIFGVPENTQFAGAYEALGLNPCLDPLHAVSARSQRRRHGTVFWSYSDEKSALLGSLFLDVRERERPRGKPSLWCRNAKKSRDRERVLAANRRCGDALFSNSFHLVRLA